MRKLRLPCVLVLSALAALMGFMRAPGAAAASSGGASSDYVRPHNDVAVTKPMVIRRGHARVVESMTLSLGDAEAVHLLGDVNVSNPGKAPLHLAVQPLADGAAVGPALKVSVPSSAFAVLPVSAWTSPLTKGQHRFAVRLSGDGSIKFVAGTLQGVGLEPLASSVLPYASSSFSHIAPVSTKGFATVESLRLTTAAASNVAVDGWLTLSGPRRGSAAVALRYLIDGTVTGASSWLTFPAGALVSLPKINFYPAVAAGAHILSWQMLASAPGVKVTAGTFGAVALPSELRTGPPSPIPSQRKYGLPFTVTVGSWQPIVSTVFDTSGASALAPTADSFMAGWMTVENPLSTAATVSVRSTTDGTPEPADPTLTLTLPARSQLTVPAGVYSCNGMTEGPHTYGIEIRSTRGGIEVQIIGWRGIAWASPTTP